MKYRKHAVWNIYILSKKLGHRVVPEKIQFVKSWDDIVPVIESYLGRCADCPGYWVISCTEDHEGRSIHSFASSHVDDCLKRRA